MYEVKISDQFSAAHRLRGYRGKCEKVHGHNWNVEVSACSQVLDKTGMVIDFKVLKTILAEVLKVLDHSDLNGLAYFKKVNPTSENIAKFIFDKLQKKGVIPSRVSVWESGSSCAAYYL